MDLEFVERWLYDIDQSSYEQVIAALEWLIDRGPQLGRPLVDTVKASRHKNMKELRPGSRGRSELKILFCLRSITKRSSSSSGRRIEKLEEVVSSEDPSC
ncbi:type II toxin-antitoxin system RelE/ParE family toxin [Acidithrix sp. C25]|uniref:type II toxin-antitoxin system RelE/ParE family toxin n=1 Tax=Acidithrix sp. C25 TaxID=1671482 RepID=UPI00191B99DF|nr:type II toxin-antitoxin system RelE/ParE family toxin [Acidithrix sp. C25]